MNKYDIYRRLRYELTQLKFNLFVDQHLEDTRDTLMSQSVLDIFYKLGKFGKYTILFRNKETNVLEDLGLITPDQFDESLTRETLYPTRLGLRVMINLFPNYINKGGQSYKEAKATNKVQTENMSIAIMLLCCLVVCLGVLTISLIGSVASIITFIGCVISGLGVVVSATHCKHDYVSLSDPILSKHSEDRLFKQTPIIVMEDFYLQNLYDHKDRFIQALVKNDAFKSIKQDPYNFLIDYINYTIFQQESTTP